MVSPSNPPERRAQDLKEAGEASHASTNLALLYEGLLTGVVRLQARRQHISDGESFRRRTKATLEEIEQIAVAAGYDGNDVRETHFAVVAFLDSVVLHSNDSIRAEWERKTLQEELFGKTDAGEEFFEKLERFRLRRDTEQLADILEVYLLCLLLGFEGRYSGRFRGELDNVVDRVRMRINDIRGQRQHISPTGILPSDPIPPAPDQGQRTNRFRLLAMVAVITTILGFLALKLDLIWISEQLRGKLP